MQEPCAPPQLRLPGWPDGMGDGESHPGAQPVSISSAPLLALVVLSSPLPWMQAPTPGQRRPSQLQLSKYLLALHAGSVLCIASTSFCFPDLTALQSNPNLPGGGFFSSLQMLLCCYVKELGEMDGQTDRWAEVDDKLTSAKQILYLDS